MMTAPRSLEHFNAGAEKRGGFTAILVMVAENGDLRIWAAEGMEGSLAFPTMLEGIAKCCRDAALQRQPQGRA